MQVLLVVGQVHAELGCECIDMCESTKRPVTGLLKPATPHVHQQMSELGYGGYDRRNLMQPFTTYANLTQPIQPHNL